MASIQQVLLGLKTSGACSDADGSAFVSAAGLTDPTQISAICQLVTDLKAASLWSKMTAIYPFVGGSASAHKYNLKDPRDLDAAFRIVWNGTVTHDANGVTGNGSTGYGDTKLAGDTNTTLNDFHASIYCRTVGGSTDNMYELGSAAGAGFAMIFTLKNQSSTGPTIGMVYRNDNGNAWVQKTDASAKGLWIFSRRGSTDFEGYKNSISFQTQTNTNTGARPARNFFILAQNNAGTAANFSNRNISFVTLGSGLSDSEALALNNCVETFQSTLGRSNNIYPYSVFPSGLSVWARYKASDLIASGDGAAIASWTDKSGNGRHAVQATSARQPNLRAAASGLLGNTCAVEFQGTDSDPHFLTINTSMAALTQGEMFVFLIKDDDDGSTARRLHQIGSAADFYYVFSDHKIYDGFGSTVRKTAGDPSPSLLSWHNYDVYSKANDWQCFINNTSVFSTVTNTVGFPASPIIGGYLAGTTGTRLMKGKIAEIVILDVPTDSAGRLAMNNYFNGEYKNT